MFKNLIIICSIVVLSGCAMSPEQKMAARVAVKTARIKMEADDAGHDVDYDDAATRATVEVLDEELRK